MTSDELLAFWFADSKRWYKKDEAFDREIEAKFGGLLEQATRGELEGWRTTPRGRLAFVILLDQFSRNMFRNTPRAFAQDTLACDAARSAIALGDEQALSIKERSFLYMPLEHSEDVAHQRECVAAFERLAYDAEPDEKSFAENVLDYARRHAEIVERFGRFPHRNIILERTSTADEIDFLKQPGSSF